MRCAAPPEKPAWMSSPQAVVVTAERVVAAWPEDGCSWMMHADAHNGIGDWSTASKSWMKAGKFYGKEGEAERKAKALRYAGKALEKLR